MSEANVEIVRAIFAAWEKGDFSSAEWADPEIEFRSVAERGPTYGVAAMAKRWGEWLKAFEHFSSHPEEYVDAGDVVLVMNRFLGTCGLPTGPTFSATLANTAPQSGSWRMTPMEEVDDCGATIF